VRYSERDSFISEQAPVAGLWGADDKSVSITSRNVLTIRAFVTLKDGTGRLSRNVGNLPIYAA